VLCAHMSMEIILTVDFFLKRVLTADSFF